ncbi:MAG: hypothetical protein AB1898_01820 [Acidobacteriota bacterium]
MTRKNQPDNRIVGEHGAGALGCLLSILLVAGLIYAAYKFGPPYINHYQLKDSMKEIATLTASGIDPKTGTIGRTEITTAQVQEAVLEKARELQIPLRKEGIKVRREGTMVWITVTYTVPVRLPGQVYDFNFHFTSHN